MNSKKARLIRKESKKFSDLSGMNYNQVYKEIKKTAKGIPLNPEKQD